MVFYTFAIQFPHNAYIFPRTFDKWKANKIIAKCKLLKSVELFKSRLETRFEVFKEGFYGWKSNWNFMKNRGLWRECDENVFRLLSDIFRSKFVWNRLLKVFSQTLVNLIILMCYKMYNIALSRLLKIKTIIKSCNFLSVICR